MAKAEPTGRELKRELSWQNYHRIVNDMEDIRQKDIADALGVTGGAISRALNDDPNFDFSPLRRRIAEYLTSLEQGRKPLPNRMHAKPMVTR